MEVEHIKKSLCKWGAISTCTAAAWAGHQRPTSENLLTMVPRTLEPKQRLCQMVTAIDSSTVESATFPHPDAALSCVYFFILLSKDASLLRLLLFMAMLAVPPVLTERQSRGYCGHLTGTWCFYVWRKRELCSPTGSDDLCAVLCPLRGLRLL